MAFNLFLMQKKMIKEKILPFVFFCYFRRNGRGGGRRKNMKTAVR